MARITCRTPSTGKPITLTEQDLGITFVTLAEAPDFSVPDASERYADRDPVDAARAIRPGEIFLLSPIAVRNKTVSTQTIEVQMIRETGEIIQLGDLEIPAGDTGFVPIQGRSLFKRDAAGTIGDRLQVRASAAAAFDVWAAGEERLSNEHSGVEEG